MSVHVWEDPSRVWQIEKWDMYWASRGMLNKKIVPPPKKKKKEKKRKKKWKFNSNSNRKWVHSNSCEWEIISVNSRYYHTKDILISYSVATTTGQKGLYLFYKVSESNRRILTMSLVGHYYYGNISAIK